MHVASGNSGMPTVSIRNEFYIRRIYTGNQLLKLLRSRLCVLPPVFHVWYSVYIKVIFLIASLPGSDKQTESERKRYILRIMGLYRLEHVLTSRQHHPLLITELCMQNVSWEKRDDYRFLECWKFWDNNRNDVENTVWIRQRNTHEPSLLWIFYLLNTGELISFDTNLVS